MAIGTYSELQTAIENWLGRDDLTVITDFISLFEAAANRRLRVRQMLTSTTLSPTDGEAALPSDYLAWRRVTWEASTAVTLEYADPVWLYSAYPTATERTPQFFTIEGANLKVRPVSNDDITLQYYQKIPVLSAGNTTNWLLTAHPDVYLFGSLCEARSYARNIEQAALWKTRRDECFDEVEKLSNKTRGPSVVRVIGQTP